MVNRTCLDCDRENGQAIAAGRGFFRFCIAVGPEDRGNSGCPIDSNRIAPNGLREFAIDIDDAVGTVGWRGVGCPTTTIIECQGRRRRSIRLTEYDGKRSNRRAGSDLCRSAAARHHDYRQRKKQENPCAFCQ